MYSCPLAVASMHKIALRHPNLGPISRSRRCNISNNNSIKILCRSYDGDLPEWFVNLTELAKDDEELADLLRETNGDPAQLEAKMKQEMDTLQSRLLGDQGGSGEESPPKIEFRQIDPFETWIWVEMYSPPTAAHKEMLQEVVNSWFMLGRLGAYDSSNLQVLYSDGVGEAFEYDPSEDSPENALSSTMHEMGELEVQGPWARFWVDMGTSDELAFDILINALKTFSKEHVGLRQVVFGGQNDDWEIPVRDYKVSMEPFGDVTTF